jgi:hypothetical protein
LFSASIAASLLVEGPVTETPPVFDLAERVVADDPVVTGDPDELAVPALLVPCGGGETIFAELPAPLGSLPELLRAPALAGPNGAPLAPKARSRHRPRCYRRHRQFERTKSRGNKLCDRDDGSHYRRFAHPESPFVIQ